MKEKFGFDSIYNEINECRLFINANMRLDSSESRWNHSAAIVTLNDITTAAQKAQESILGITLKIDSVLKSGSDNKNKLSKIEACLRELEKLLEGTAK